MNNQYEKIKEDSIRGIKKLTVLIDPDKTEKLNELLEVADKYPPSFFLVGDSQSQGENLEACIVRIRESSSLPILLFPGNNSQIHSKADALLLLSLISGRNAELLIGQHVKAALPLKKSGLEIIPTGYLLIDGGNISSVVEVSKTEPIAPTNETLIISTALAGEQLGMKLIYLEAGSGASDPVPLSLINKVKRNLSIPLFTGGGLKTTNDIHTRFEAGADVVVVGNILEHFPALLKEFVQVVPKN